MFEFYVGGYGQSGDKSIVKFQADFEKKLLEEVHCAMDADRPSYILANKENGILYAVKENGENSGLYAFEITDGGLKKQSFHYVMGQDPCHLMLDESGKNIFSANYSSGSASVFSLDEFGRVKMMTDRIADKGKGPVKGRQDCAHIHCCMAANGYVYMCDLGIDQVVVVKLDKGKLKEQGRIDVPKGAGARHILFSSVYPQIAYVVGELDNTVNVFEINGFEGKLLQRESLLPEDFTQFSKAAAIRESADKKAIFVSNRGHDSIAVFEVLEGGKLKRRGIYPSGGKEPRDFNVFGEYIVVANQFSDSINVLKYDHERFEIADTGISADAVKPTCVAII